MILIVDMDAVEEEKKNTHLISVQKTRSDPSV